MISFDRRLIQNFDWIFLLIILALAGLGLVNLYSASQGSAAPTHFKQMVWLGISLGVMAAVLFFDYHLMEKMAYPLYLLGLALLVLVLLTGRPIAGTRRWLDLGPVGFQPAEAVKFIMIAVFARYFSRRDYPGGLRLRDLVWPMILLLPPFALILRQPDLGTSLHLAIICGTIILFIGIRWDTLLYIASSLAAALPFVWWWLKPYQQGRILTFLNPQRDPQGAGYHIIQSKIAVGSGQLWGKGFMKGTQSQLRFLPERHTDFIFSVFAEEWGFVGSLVLLGFYFLLIVWGLRIVARSQDRFAAFMGVGLLALVFWQFVFNICMVIGLMPVVGIPLPLLSYGGSSMVTIFVAFGLLLNIGMRRFMFQN